MEGAGPGLRGNFSGDSGREESISSEKPYRHVGRAGKLDIDGASDTSIRNAVPNDFRKILNNAQANVVFTAGQETDAKDYYVRMMAAWYFATALTKQYDAAPPYIEKHALSDWVHAKAIQKARESLVIRPEQKEYLKSLKKDIDD